jgi:hypothetical protein
MTRLKERASVGPIGRELEKLSIAKADELGRFANTIKELSERLDYPSTAERMVQLELMVTELNEYFRWLSPPLSAMSPDEREETLQAAEAAWLAKGHTPLEALEYLQNAQRKLRGRPPTKRHLAVVALDMWLTNPKLSWAQVTRKICQCGSSTHGDSCQEQLRQQVNDLRATLKKFGIMEPARRKLKAL